MPKNLFTSNKFKFILTGSRFKDNEFDLTVTDINIPGIILGTVDQHTSIRTVKRPGDSLTFSDVTIEFLITENFEEWVTIQEWINDLRDSSQNTFDNTILSDGKLILLTNKNNANVELTFTGMFPIELAEMQLSISTADGEPVKGNVTFNYLEMIVGIV